jgi:hypothetical protein
MDDGNLLTRYLIHNDITSCILALSRIVEEDYVSSTESRLHGLTDNMRISAAGGKTHEHR